MVQSQFKTFNLAVDCHRDLLWIIRDWHWHNGPLARYIKLRGAHAPGMPGTFSPPPRVSNPDMHHGTCVTHVPWCMPGLLTSSCLWSRWRGKRSRHSWRMHYPQFYASGKRPMALRMDGWMVWVVWRHEVTSRTPAACGRFPANLEENRLSGIRYMVTSSNGSIDWLNSFIVSLSDTVR